MAELKQNKQKNGKLSLYPLRVEEAVKGLLEVKSGIQGSTAKTPKDGKSSKGRNIMITKPDEKIFEQLENVRIAYPDMNNSYIQFLQDLKQYGEFKQFQENEPTKRQDATDYLIFGASFDKHLGL